MTFCTVDEVKASIDFPATGAPISDTDILGFIYDSQEEIHNIYKTKFGNVESTGTATSGTVSSLTDTGATFTTSPVDYTGYVVYIVSGTGSGQYREIVSNTSTILTVSPNFDTAPDNTSVYRVTTLGYKDQTVDGTGTGTYFIEYQPLINLNSLSIDSISITNSNVYKYYDSGRLLLSSGSEQPVFLNNTPQLVNLKYIFGVYPLPRIIKRLCIIIASIRTLTAQIAGTYDDFSSVSLPGGVTGSKGEPYINIQSALQKLQAEARGIIYGDTSGGVTSDFRIIASYRPFTIFE